MIIEYNDFPKLIECLKEIQYLFNKSLAETKSTPMKTTIPNLIPMMEVMETLRLSRRHIDSLVDKKMFPKKIKIGRRTMFDAKEIERYIETVKSGKEYKRK